MLHTRTHYKTTRSLTLALALLSGALAQPSISGNVLTGKIVDWPAGKTGTVNMTNVPTPVTAPIAIDGTFTLTLPDPTSFSSSLGKLDSLFQPVSSYDEGCIGTGTATPATGTYQGFYLQASVDGDMSTNLDLNDNDRLPAPSGQQFGVLYYFGAATSIDGSVSCPGAGYVDTLKGNFPAGWSLASGTVTQVNPDKSYTETITADALPEAVNFHLYHTLIGVGLTLIPSTRAGSGYVVSVLSPGKPAELAGLQLNDVVVQVDGKEVTVLPQAQVLNLIRGDAPGTTVVIGVQRNGDATIIPITITRALVTTR